VTTISYSSGSCICVPDRQRSIQLSIQLSIHGIIRFKVFFKYYPYIVLIYYWYELCYIIDDNDLWLISLLPV